MSFLDNLILPRWIALNQFSGRISRKTDIATMDSGHEQRIGRWSKSRRSWDAGLVPRIQSEWEEIAGFFEITEGPLHGFRVLDGSDFQITASNGLLQPLDANGDALGTIGLGYGMPTFQIYKRYTASPRTHDREINKIVTAAGSIVYRAASPVTQGVSAGNCAINVDTGVVTFVADSSSTVTGVTVGATTDVTLTGALSGLGIGDRLYLAGLTGSGAGTLNGKSHAITNIVTNTYTLSTVTTGLAITAAGSGYKYPQASEAMTFSGQFHVPARFGADELEWSVVNRSEGELLIQSGSIPIIEIRL